MINMTYLHPMRKSDYSNRVSSCHEIWYCPAPPSNKNSPHSKLKLPSHKTFQLPLPNSASFYPLRYSSKIFFKLPSTGDKKNVDLLFFLKFSTLTQH